MGQGDAWSRERWGRGRAIENVEGKRFHTLRDQDISACRCYWKVIKASSSHGGDEFRCLVEVRFKCYSCVVRRKGENVTISQRLYLLGDATAMGKRSKNGEEY